MGFRALAEPVSRLVVPATLGPTQLARAASCQLSGLLGAVHLASDRLPPDPRAFIGTILHRVVEDSYRGRICGNGTPAELIAGHLASLFRQKGEDLAGGELAHYVPLGDTITYAEYLDRSTRARKRAVDCYREPSPQRGEAPAEGLAGVERLLVSKSLGVAGRADVVEETATEVVVRDLKTGSVRDRDGIAPHVAFQLRVYALLAQECRPGKRVRIFVDHAVSEELPWGPTEELAIRGELERIRAALPPGAAVDARQIASVGEACRWCDFRHVCPAFREEAPQLWSTVGLPYVPPQDVAGTLEDAPKARENGVSLRLCDLAGRPVSIVGLSRDTGCGRSCGRDSRCGCSASRRGVATGTRIGSTHIPSTSESVRCQWASAGRFACVCFWGDQAHRIAGRLGGCRQ